jgi:Bacteriophage minor capsid protein
VGFVEDIASVLTSASIGTVGTNIFYTTRATIPSDDGPYISLIETAGFPDFWIQNDKTRPAFERPGAQIIVRAARYTVARDKAIAVHYEIRKVINRFVGQNWYRWIKPLQLPFDDGTDKENRARIKFNAICDRSPYA